MFSFYAREFHEHLLVSRSQKNQNMSEEILCSPLGNQNENVLKAILLMFFSSEIIFPCLRGNPLVACHQIVWV